MTNRERYRRTFEALHVSDECLKEVYSMKESRKIKNIGRTLLIAACVTALLTMSAFAANEVTGGAVARQVYLFVDGIMGSYVPNGNGVYTFTGEDGQEYTITSNTTDGEVILDDGQVMYSSTYEFEFDGDEVHSFAIEAEEAVGVDVNP